MLALGVNISNYLVLGKTSPLTYQVLGHLKTVLILVLGFTVFQVFIQGFLFTFTSVLIHQLILPTETGGFTKCGWYLDRYVGVSILLLQMILQPCHYYVSCVRTVSLDTPSFVVGSRHLPRSQRINRRKSNFIFLRSPFRLLQHPEFIVRRTCTASFCNG